MSQDKPKSYNLELEEKVTQIMVYTQNFMTWGDLVSKELVRVSTWLRTPTAPPYLVLHDSQLLYTSGAAAALAYQTLHIPAGEVLAYHILPPNQDPPDYDPGEPNRKLEPVSLLLGPYRLDGHLRMAASSNVARYLEVMSEKYTSLYQVTVSLPQRSNMKPLSVPFVLVRREPALFIR
jgi:hypothetical protein